MSDCWYYTHAGQTLGPVTSAQLRQLAATGQLSPTDFIWLDGTDRAQAVQVQAALDLSATPDKPAQSGDETIEVEQELLSLEFDADVGPDDAELIEAELVEEVEAEDGSCRLIVGSATTRGRVRDRNEDSLLVQQCSWGNRDERHEVVLAVVADGMGGHQAGDRASGLVIRTLGGALAPLLSAALGGQDTPTPAALADALDNGLREANRVVVQAATENPACKGMGSTAVAMLVWDDHAAISLVGDCRVYHWREGTLSQVTRDQTLVGRMVELGQLTPEEAARHPRRNEVTQAVGKHGRLEPARYEVALRRGDWLVASCDGLYAHVEAPQLGETIAQSGASAIGLANRLIELANQGGGSDNCTVIAVHCV